MIMKKIMFNEIWKKTELYGRIIEFSDLGNYRFVDGKNNKKKRLNAYGYYVIPIWHKNKLHNVLIHRQVALLFVNNPSVNEFDCVNHKDEIKTNNRADNLEWCDRRGNNNYGSHNAKIAKSHSKPIEQYTLDGMFIKEWESATIASRELGYAQSAINWCCLRKPKYNSCHGFLWKYKNDNSNLSYKNGKTIIMLSKEGEPIKEFFNITLAVKETGISPTSISNVLHGMAKTAGGYKWKIKD